VCNLLMLLAEISPESATLTAEGTNLDFSTHSFVNGNSIETPTEPSAGVDDSAKVSVNGNIANGTNQKREISQQQQGKATPDRKSFFVHLASPQLSNHSKWLDGDPMTMLQLPLIDKLHTATLTRPNSINEDGDTSYNLAPSLISLNCVVPKMKFEDCAAAQKYCIAHLSSLRHTMATSSFDGCLYMEGPLRKEAVPYLPPLEIISASIVKSESHLLLDRTKAAGFTVKVNESIRTFFNPYDKRAKDESLGKNLITVVAEGEERTIQIEFNNRLSIPIDIPSCQLEFDKSRTIEIEAPPLSFTVPASSDSNGEDGGSFVVNFPFIVVDNSKRRLDMDGGTTRRTASSKKKIKKIKASSKSSPTSSLPKASNSFEVVGVRVSCFNRNISIPFENSNTDEKDAANKSSNTSATQSKESRKSLQKQMPDAASVYQRNHPKKTFRPILRPPRDRSRPTQPPRLILHLANPTRRRHHGTSPPIRRRNLHHTTLSTRKRLWTEWIRTNGASPNSRSWFTRSTR